MRNKKPFLFCTVGKDMTYTFLISCLTQYLIIPDSVQMSLNKQTQCICNSYFIMHKRPLILMVVF